MPPNSLASKGNPTPPHRSKTSSTKSLLNRNTWQWPPKLMSPFIVSRPITRGKTQQNPDGESQSLIWGERAYTQSSKMSLMGLVRPKRTTFKGILAWIYEHWSTHPGFQIQCVGFRVLNWVIRIWTQLWCGGLYCPRCLEDSSHPICLAQGLSQFSCSLSQYTLEQYWLF